MADNNDNTDIEAQVERAMAAYKERLGVYASEMTSGVAREVLVDFAAGKFREPELPEIARPPGLVGKPSIHTDLNGQSRVQFSQSCIRDWAIYGPYRSSKHYAILAWNAVFAPGARNDQR